MAPVLALLDGLLLREDAQLIMMVVLRPNEAGQKPLLASLRMGSLRVLSDWIARCGLVGDSGP